MNGGSHWTMIRGKYFSAVFCQSKLCSEETLGGGCAETDNQLRMNGGNLSFQPWAAGCYFQRVWLLVQPNLSARLPFEVLHSIGDVDLAPIDPRRLEAFIEQLAGRSDKRLPLLVFAIAGLLSYQQNSGMGSAFPKDDLRRLPIKVASTTLFGRFPQAIEVMSGGKELEG